MRVGYRPILITNPTRFAPIINHQLDVEHITNITEVTIAPLIPELLDREKGLRRGLNCPALSTSGKTEANWDTRIMVHERTALLALTLPRKPRALSALAISPDEYHREPVCSFTGSMTETSPTASRTPSVLRWTIQCQITDWQRWRWARTSSLAIDVLPFPRRRGSKRRDYLTRRNLYPSGNSVSFNQQTPHAAATAAEILEFCVIFRHTPTIARFF